MVTIAIFQTYSMSYLATEVKRYQYIDSISIHRNNSGLNIQSEILFHCRRVNLIILLKVGSSSWQCKGLATRIFCTNSISWSLNITLRCDNDLIGKGRRSWWFQMLPKNLSELEITDCGKLCLAGKSQQWTQHLAQRLWDSGRRVVPKTGHRIHSCNCYWWSKVWEDLFKEVRLTSSHDQ